MASTAYSKVSYHATRDDAKESIPEALLHNANNRENSEGDRLSQHSGSTRRNSRDGDIETAIPERNESKSRGKCTNFTTRCMKNPFFICTIILNQFMHHGVLHWLFIQPIFLFLLIMLDAGGYGS